ncbi:ankyrin repeat domain-containing protein [Deinococcus gobiensis]|uniref:ankyrin repeat domain-containing protein n=1 Tax=Deinococcus gobiensis TaxID=502394 RepID=UPI000318247F|nr:ankyrin repeat domain-containing protein [Deinococcus gobiensis]
MTDAGGAGDDAATLLFAAIHAHNLPGVQALIAAEPGLLEARSPSGLSPVLFAVYYHRPDILRALIGAGAPLDVFAAAATGETGALRGWLKRDPALLRAFSPDGYTPLGLAALFGRTEAARLLLGHGADVNAPSRGALPVRPLHSAVSGLHRDLARLLLDAGADVNAAQPGGLTPLMLAALRGDTDLAGLLLARGAWAGATDEEGRTAADLAAEDGHEALVTRLREAARQPQETRNAARPRPGQTGPMNNDDKVIGQSGAVTGFDTPDPKDDAQPRYTTTPAGDGVSSADHMTYESPEVPDPTEVTGQFAHLATRNPEAMEHRLQDPEFAGAETTEGLGGEALAGVTPSAGLGYNASLTTAATVNRGLADPNPGYTPPSESGPPHVSEQPGDLPPGETTELQAEVEGDSKYR